MSIRLFDLAPDFDANTSLGKIRFHEWLGDSWGVLFSHPADFTPVCTTELGAVAKRKSDFQKRNVRVIALSVDSVEAHTAWISDINETQGVELDFPIIADPDFTISHLYGFVHPNASDRFTVRSVVVIDPDKKVKLIITYPASTGRNFDELIRVIDSLQLTAKYSQQKIFRPNFQRVFAPLNRIYDLHPSLTCNDQLRERSFFVEFCFC